MNIRGLLAGKRNMLQLGVLLHVDFHSEERSARSTSTRRKRKVDCGGEIENELIANNPAHLLASISVLKAPLCLTQPHYAASAGPL